MSDKTKPTTRAMRSILNGLGIRYAKGYEIQGREGRVNEDDTTFVGAVCITEQEDSTFTVDGLSPAQVVAAVAEIPSGADLKELCQEAISVVIGWGMKLNELSGRDPMDMNAYPMHTAKGLIDRMHALGFGFGDGDGDGSDHG